MRRPRVILRAPKDELLNVSVESLDDEEAASLSLDPEIIGVPPVMTTMLPRAVDDPGHADVAWGIDAVGATASHYDGSGIKVAVLDSGIDLAHDAFAGIQPITNDFSGQGIEDRHGHGTHLAGTLVGRDVSGLRIGVARGVTELCVGKILGDDGVGLTDWLFSGLTWAMEEQVHVACLAMRLDFLGLVDNLIDIHGYSPEAATACALGDYGETLRALDAAMSLLTEERPGWHGAVVVAAVGNESRWDKLTVPAGLPAAANGTVRVSAITLTGLGVLRVADFCNSNADVCGPGVSILSAKAGDAKRVALDSGTSMASPHVAGVAALWWQHLIETQGHVRGSDVAARLIGTSRRDHLERNLALPAAGAGLVQAPP